MAGIFSIPAIVLFQATGKPSHIFWLSIRLVDKKDFTLIRKVTLIAFPSCKQVQTNHCS